MDAPCSTMALFDRFQNFNLTVLDWKGSDQIGMLRKCCFTFANVGFSLFQIIHDEILAAAVGGLGHETGQPSGFQE